MVKAWPTFQSHTARSLADTSTSPGAVGQLPVVIVRCSQTRSRAMIPPGERLSPGAGWIAMPSVICPIGWP